MREHDDLLERGIALLREPVVIDGGVNTRVMDAVARLPLPARPSRLHQAGTWLIHPRPIRVRPVVVLAAAAALAVAAVGLRDRAEPPAAPTVTAAARAGPAPVRFILVAPTATAVSLVGDFNDWIAAATPMEGDVAEGLWVVTVPLPPGRYRYAFLVDGATWVPDPNAPRTIDDDFGRPNSVLTIGGS
ncbi:MAG: isoamylase early set domain-containing protein [Gemmatimonadota bacterium]|nr:isoamylase early set domain-containing protein [Gemmatimonadota bacterium]MDH4349769.1 isoamylase early set domain-containing protein [Gemmatimonadota bacterium]MDH5197710.1 isoamylase early set domain-containing protein [Gemmatimonadota bacterium]